MEARKLQIPSYKQKSEIMLKSRRTGRLLRERDRSMLLATTSIACGLPAKECGRSELTYHVGVFFRRDTTIK